MTHYVYDDREVRVHFEKNAHMNAKTVLALEAALTEVFQATQAAVHVRSGRLKASGRMESHGDEDSWEGTFSFGGRGSLAPYASYEQARGGSHDFLEVAEHLDSVIGVAFRVGLED